jgi:DNA-binding MarR family transcriptional regulator
MDNHSFLPQNIGQYIGYLHYKLKKEINSKLVYNLDTSHKDLKQYTFVNIQIINYLYINEDKDIFQKDIEKNFSIKASTVSATLRRMEKLDMIRRENVKQDARLKRIVLTTKTRRFKSQMIQQSEDIEKEFHSALSEEEYNTLLTLLAKVNDTLKNRQ